MAKSKTFKVRVDALYETAPNGRDYQTEGPDAYPAARDREEEEAAREERATLASRGLTFAEAATEGASNVRAIRALDAERAARAGGRRLR